MSKRSRKIAKRDEFEKALKGMEEQLRSRRGSKPAAITPTSPALPERKDGESEDHESTSGGKTNSE